jgi:acyl carrier protein
MEEQLKKIMSDIFSIDVKDINKDSSPQNILKWDSLGHLNLITSIEEEFGIIIDEEQMTKMLNFGLVLETINECLKNK